MTMRARGAILALFVLIAPVAGQDSGNEMVIVIPEVEVRSGPTLEYYPTSKLYYGSKVIVLRESKQPGWLAIKPPPGSFSWINAKFVKKKINGTVLSWLMKPLLFPFCLVVP